MIDRKQKKKWEKSHLFFLFCFEGAPLGLRLPAGGLVAAVELDLGGVVVRKVEDVEQPTAVHRRGIVHRRLPSRQIALSVVQPAGHCQQGEKNKTHTVDIQFL